MSSASPPTLGDPASLDPSLLIGQPVIDDEHAALMAQLHRLQEASSQPAGSGDFSESFSQLGQLIAAHFDSEERTMTALGVPLADFAAHVMAHDEILIQYAALNLDRMRGARLQPSEVVTVVRGWIVDHLLQHDLKIRDFVDTRRAKP